MPKQILSDLDFNSAARILNLPDPTLAQHPATKAYVDKTFDEQMEISSLAGNISEKDGNVYLHLHANLGRADYTVVGGHLLTATINGACEVFVRRFGCKVGRHFDEETGLNLYTL